MGLQIQQHPCYNHKARNLFGRVHLPVATRCNIQCNYCNRNFDCMNESRPGVTSAVLSPSGAVRYLYRLKVIKSDIAVAAIAGPGDPFANPVETMETLRQVRRMFPDILLCLATNGLNIIPYIDDLISLNVTHVTITVNAVDIDVASKIYSWVRYGKRIYSGEEGAGLLVRNQLNAIPLLKKGGIEVKVNTVLIPGINDFHVKKVADVVSQLGADLMNIIPLHPVEKTVFADIKEPAGKTVRSLKKKMEDIIPQMWHCRRCRADAAGLIGKDMSPEEKVALMKDDDYDILPGMAAAAGEVFS